MFKAPDTDVDQAAEAELQRLQKQVRKMEKDRRTFIDEKSRKHSKRQKIIETLRAERNGLRDQVADLQTGPHAKRAHELEHEMQDLIDQKAIVDRAYADKKLDLWQLDGNIKKLEKEIRHLQEAEVTDRKYHTALERNGLAAAKLENQLDVVTKRWGATMADNTQMRADIDHQLLERAHFNTLWQRSYARLEQGKRYIGELIDQSTVAYEQREELCSKIQGLRERGLTEGSVHLQEMREMQRRLDHDAKLQQFFTCKGNRRQNAELEQREAQKRDQEQQTVQQQIDDYEQLLTHIQLLTGEPQVDKLAECFRKQEEENFALFSYVNELNSEVETLQEAVQGVEKAIDKQSGDNAQKERAQLESAEMLQRELDVRRADAAEMLAIQLNIEQKLSDLLAGVARIFDLIRCDEAPVLELLSDGTQVTAGSVSGATAKPITIHNVQLFLGVVRRRAQLIINTVNMAELPTGVKVLARKDRVPKFNVKESAKGPTATATMAKR